jgi:hypothetical protein
MSALPLKPEVEVGRFDFRLGPAADIATGGRQLGLASPWAQAAEGMMRIGKRCHPEDLSG